MGPLAAGVGVVVGGGVLGAGRERGYGDQQGGGQDEAHEFLLRFGSVAQTGCLSGDGAGVEATTGRLRRRTPSTNRVIVTER